MWHLLANNSTIIQAISALASALLTIVLVVVTIRYVTLTHQMVTLADKQFRAGVQPQLSVKLDWAAQGEKRIGFFRFKNVGPNSFMISRASFSWYCAHSEQTLVRPREFPLLRSRVLPPGQATSQRFEVDPLSAELHEDHEGDCNWIFRTDVQIEDLAGTVRHEYSYDEALGLSYVRDYGAFTWWSAMRGRWHNRWMWARYKLKVWRRALQERIADIDGYPPKGRREV